MNEQLSVVETQLDREGFGAWHRAHIAVRRILVFLARTNLLLAANSAIIVWMVQLLAGLPHSAEPPLIGFLIFFAIYTVDRIAEPEADDLTHPERRSFSRRYARQLWVAAGLASLLGIGLAMRGGVWRVTGALLPPVALGLYSFPFIPGPLARRIGFSRLKEVLVLKNGVVAFTFATTHVLLPLSEGDAVARGPLLAMWVFLFGRFFINTVTFDLRDEEGDRQHGVRTLPVVLGPERTRQVLHLLNVALGLGLLAVPALGWGSTLFLALQAGTVYAGWYVWRSGQPGDIHFLCDVLVDGELFVNAAALLLLWSYIPL
jgi:4-hydroxybenzoate polyprenyltransferase